MQIDNLKILPLITSGEYIKDANMFFFALDNNMKNLVALKNNRDFNLLKTQYIGNFEEKNDMNFNQYNNFKKYIIMYSYYDNKKKKLFLGDSFGFLICYDLSSLFDKLINNELLLKEDIKNIVQNEINYPIVYNIELYKEPITYIFKPEELIPHVLIVASSNRMVNLIEYETGKFIDSLKQISILNYPFPIAIRYNIENPFEKKYHVVKTEGNKEKEEKDQKEEENPDNNEENNQYLMTNPNLKDEEDELDKKYYPNIIYRKNVEFDQEPPKMKKIEDRQTELVRYSNAVLIYTVKEKLRIPKYEKDIPGDKSTLWNYEIDIENLKKINEENMSKLIRLVGNKEKEINVTENNFQKYSINTKNYLPKYIKDLEQNEKDKIKEAISRKINDVNLAFNKREKVKKEINDISKIDNKINININDSDNIFLNFSKSNDSSNFFLTPLKPIKSKSVNKNKKSENKLPLIEENIQKNLVTDKNKSKNEKNIKSDKDININKSNKKSRNIKIIHSPNRHNFIGNIFKNFPNTKDSKFNEYKNQFDEKINEIMGPIEFIKLRKKKTNSKNHL